MSELVFGVVAKILLRRFKPFRIKFAFHWGSIVEPPADPQSTPSKSGRITTPSFRGSKCGGPWKNHGLPKVHHRDLGHIARVRASLSSPHGQGR